VANTPAAPTPANAEPAPDSANAEPEPDSANAEPAPAAEDEPAPAAPSAAHTLRAGALPSTAFHLDGKLDEPAWRTADSIVNLVTIEPEEGGAPAGQTVVKVLANPGEIVIGVLSRDTNPAGIVAYSKARDAELEFEDHVVIVLDAFQDGRSGYVFAVNHGARFTAGDRAGKTSTAIGMPCGRPERRATAAGGAPKSGSRSVASASRKA
jgi:hypothetical protein